MNKTHSILIEDMRTGQMQVMEFYAYQAALDAIERICDDSDKKRMGLSFWELLRQMRSQNLKPGH
jgi:hypothetical protein